VESFFESVVRDHSKGHAVTAPSSTTTRSPSYRYTTLLDSTLRVHSGCARRGYNRASGGVSRLDVARLLVGEYAI